MNVMHKQLQMLELAFPPPPPEDPRTTRKRLALEMLPMDTLDKLIALAMSAGTGRELTEAEWEAHHVQETALTSAPVPAKQERRAGQ